MVSDLHKKEKTRLVRDISDAFSGTFVNFQKKLQIEPMKLADLEEMITWPKFEDRNLSWANFPVKTEDLRRQWYNQQQKGHLQWLMIRDLDRNELISRSSITEPISGNGVMYGIVVRPDRLGQGYGTLITKIMVKYIFEVKDIDFIWLESRYDNVRAQKTWEKIGFTKKGMHFRREVFGRYDRYIGYEFNRLQLDDIDLPEIEVQILD